MKTFYCDYCKEIIESDEDAIVINLEDSVHSYHVDCLEELYDLIGNGLNLYYKSLEDKSIPEEVNYIFNDDGIMVVDLNSEEDLSEKLFKYLQEFI